MVKIGSIIEIPVISGFGYAQYTHTGGQGDVIRVLDIICEKPLSNLSELQGVPERFAAQTFPDMYIRDKKWRLAGALSIREEFLRFPTFKSGRLSKSGKVHWSIWDDRRFYEVDALTEEMESWPEDGVFSWTVIEDRIENNYRPSALDICNLSPAQKAELIQSRKPSEHKIAGFPAKHPVADQPAIAEAANCSKQSDAKYVVVEILSPRSLDEICHIEDFIREKLDNWGLGEVDGHEIRVSDQRAYIYVLGDQLDKLESYLAVCLATGFDFRFQLKKA